MLGVNPAHVSYRDPSYLLPIAYERMFNTHNPQTTLMDYLLQTTILIIISDHYIVNHVVDYRVQYFHQNAATPTAGGNNQPGAAAHTIGAGMEEEEEEQQRFMEEAAHRVFFNRKMMSVLPQLGKIAPRFATKLLVTCLQFGTIIQASEI
eukprot:scaffold3353_cov79-Cylindrotheca_fusiformis.AAC.4